MTFGFAGMRMFVSVAPVCSGSVIQPSVPASAMVLTLLAELWPLSSMK